MTINWTPLDQELERWSGDHRTIPVWWRDDDAVSVTPALQRLRQVSDDLNVPVHLAVIPAHAQAELGGYLNDHTNLLAVVHGWAHKDHAPRKEKKAEFGDHRPVDVMSASCSDGLRHLQDMFGPRLSPMFVPPWNRVSAELIKQLPACGYRAISTFKPRSAPFAAPGLYRINTHLDPINWRGGKTLVDPDKLILQIAQQLAERRTGQSDADEPYGILTHHLVHDEPIWSFCEALLSRLAAGPVRLWTADELNRNTGDQP